MPLSKKIRIGGIQKLSLIDFNEHLSCVLFTLGCNFRCPYCHNPELVKVSNPEISLDYIFDFLEKRKGKLDAVVITGGEPTLHRGLKEFITIVKSLGYLIKLDTNGTNSKLLLELINENLIDYVAMDIKSSLVNYQKVIKTRVRMEEIKKSINILINSSIDYEFRTTVVKNLMTYDDILEIGKTIKGAPRYFLQNFVAGKVLDTKNHYDAFEHQTLENLKQKLEEHIETVVIR